MLCREGPRPGYHHDRRPRLSCSGTMKYVETGVSLRDFLWKYGLPPYNLRSDRRLQYFAHGAARQTLKDVYFLRCFDRPQFPLDRRLERIAVECRTGFKGDGGMDYFSPLGIRHSDHGAIGDRSVGANYHFDIARIDVESPGNNHIT